MEVIDFISAVTRNTPVSGDKSKVQAKLNDEKKALMEDWKAAKEAAAENGNTELLYHVPCMEEDSAKCGIDSPCRRILQTY